jgi:uncharacterized damage-inducible protein DinB
MFSLIRDLIQHQAWADATLLQAIHSNKIARADAVLLANLHHIVAVHCYFLALLRDERFDRDADTAATLSFTQLEERFRHAHRDQLALIKNLNSADLTRIVPMADLPGTEPSLGQSLLQVVLHSQNHRGQALTRLRELGGTPPTLDFIVWLKNQPRP